MGISSLQLDAFFAVAQAGGFSAAAKKLSLTQSALSQRVLNLEAELGTTLFIRESSGLRLTDQGQKLLRYCQSRQLLEEEFLEDLKGATYGDVKGIVRIAGFSTVNVSLVVPLLGRLAKDHSGIQVSLLRREIRELPAALLSGQADFLLLNHALEKPGIENHLLGYEENVFVRSTLKKARTDVFLDHDEEDPTTFEFFRLQGKKNPVLKRNFLGGIEAILEGVKSGLGLAIVPRHLARAQKGLEIDEDYKPLRVPVYLCYHSQAFYTSLQKEVIRRIREEIPAGLEA